MIKTTSQEKRKTGRVTAFWRIYHKKKVWGYSVDISTKGMKIWVHEKNIPDEFTVGLKHPEKYHAEPIYFDVKKVWMVPRQYRNREYIEVGCQFRNLTPQQNEYINDFIHYYKKI